MTAYGISPVGARGVERDREQRIDIPSRYDLMVENERLRLLLQRVGHVAESRAGWRERYEQESQLRLDAQHRLNRAMRILAEFGRVSRSSAAAVERARREIWRLDRGV